MAHAVQTECEARQVEQPATVQGSALGKVKAGELLTHVASQVGGKGGGRPDAAQGAGNDGPALVAALNGVKDWVSALLN